MCARSIARGSQSVASKNPFCVFTVWVHGFSAGHQTCATNAFVCWTTLDPRESNFSSFLFEGCEGCAQRVPLLGTVTGGLVSFGWVMLLLFLFFYVYYATALVFIRGYFVAFKKNQLYSFSWEGLGRSRNSAISSSVQQLRVPVLPGRYSLSAMVSVRAITAGVPTVHVHQLINGNSPCGFHNDQRINTQG